MAYDDCNIFAKILRSEIPCNKVFENDEVLAFHDIAPQAPVHVLVISKAPFVSFDDFSQQTDSAAVGRFFEAVAEVADKLGLKENGYRLITNHGIHSGQEVPHLHVHILGGTQLGGLLTGLSSK